MTWSVALIVVGSAVFALSCIGVRWTRRLALARRVLDIPNPRSSHVVPVPTGGGAPVVVITTAGIWLAWAVRPEVPWATVAPLSLASLAVAGISAVDDVRPQPAWLRLAVHVAAGLVVAGTLGPLYGHALSSAGVLVPELARTVVVVLWVVGVTNAYNFMDGIDGIAGLQAVMAGLGWVALGSVTGQPVLSIVGLLLASSSLGFLTLNWAPARIFMGDVGSAFLGFWFAVLAVGACRAGPATAFAGVVLVWPFLFDTAFTLCRRLLRRERVFSAHRSHLYQRLVIAGHGHARVTLLYGLLAALGGVLGVLIAAAPRATGGALLAIGLMAVTLWLHAIRAERRMGPRGNDGLRSSRAGVSVHCDRARTDRE